MPSVPDPEHVKPWYLRNITEALALDDASGNVYVRTGFVGNIIISGNVNIPGNVQVYSTPEDPVHTHITEIGTSDILDVPYMPIDGNVVVTSGNITFTNTTIEVTQGTDPWNISGNVDVLSLPAITGNVNANVSGNVGIIGNVNVTQGTSPWITNATVTGGNVDINYPDSAVTAFEEPFAVTITPVIQADAMYGLDPDFWVTSELRGGTVTTTSDTTWQVQSGTTAGGYARLATAKYMTYQPGQGSMFRWTAAFTTYNGGNTKAAFGIDDIAQNTGPIDREDGYSFGFSGQTGTDPDTGADRRRMGILHRRAGKAETRKLTITVAPTGAQTATVTLDGVPYSVNLTASASVNYTANEIAKALKLNTTADNTWDIEGCNGVITFTYYSPGPKGGIYSFSSTGTGTIATGSFSQLIAGATPIDVWTYVDDWDNQTIQFDPSKLNVFGVDFRWLGAGRVRFFMEDPSTGKFVIVHTQRWASRYTVPHLAKPSMRIIYRSGTTNPAITPSQNVIVTGASVFAAIQGIINQTGGSQGWYNIDSTSRAKDLVWHLMSIQNPYVRGNGVNKASIILQNLTVAAQGNDPSVIYVVKNAIGTSDILVYQAIPNTTFSMFAQYSISAVSENLAVDRITNIQTLGINSSSQFDLANYNLALAPGETVSVFISSSNALNRTAIGITWKVD